MTAHAVCCVYCVQELSKSRQLGGTPICEDCERIHPIKVAKHLRFVSPDTHNELHALIIRVGSATGMEFSEALRECRRIAEEEKEIQHG